VVGLQVFSIEVNLSSPLIERELRVALRARAVPKTRLTAAAVGAGICGLFLIVAVLGGDREIGRSMHRWLFLVSLSFAVLQPAKDCLGLFCEERRTQTFELLYLTGMRPGELFVGKIIGCLLATSAQLLALVPVLALPFLSGGVSLQLFLDTLICLPLLLLFTASICVLASVVCSDEGAILVFALALGALVCLATPLPYALGKSLTSSAPFTERWLAASPGYAALLVGMNFSYGPSSAFPLAATFTFLWSVVFLVSAGLLLGLEWRRLPNGEQNPLRALWGELVRRASRQGTDRNELLDRNPFQWLVERDAALVVAAWAGIGCVCLIWLLGWWAWPHNWPSTFNFFVTAMLLLLIVYNLELQAAARRLGEDRRNGLLELLLTTPLGADTVVDGQLDAMRQQFRTIRYTVFCLFAGMAVAGFLVRSWNWRAVVLYVAIWACFIGATLKFPLRSALRTMWVSLNTGRAGYSVFRSQGGGGWQMFWIFWNLSNAISVWGRPSLQFPTGSVGEFAAMIFIGLLTFVVTAVKWSNEPNFRQLFIEHLRPIAQEPVPSPNDPRLKKWKLQEPLRHET
jgi:hypothetical protein